MDDHRKLIKHCRLSAIMTTDRCNAIRRANSACIGCDGNFAHSVRLDIPAPIYEYIKPLADEDGITVAEEIQRFICDYAIALASRQRRAA